MASSGKAKLTLKDVAESLGISRTTASNAFNRPEQLSKALRDEILSKAREMGYFGPDPRARAMRRRELHEVGVVFHHDLAYALSDPSSVEFLRGVATELDARELTLHLIPKVGRKLLLAAAFQTTADILIVHADIGAELVPDLRTAQKPVVLVDSKVPGFASVGIDDRLGAALAMGHALAGRPDKVIVLTFPLAVEDPARAQPRRPMGTGFVSNERMAGYLAAAKKAGFSADRILPLTVDDWAPESAAERVADVRGQLAAGERVAIVAMSDRLALAAQKAVRGWRGLKIVAIVGFDDIPAAAAAGLTTIRQDHFQKGALCVRVLIDGIKPHVLPIELVLRDT